MEDGPARVQVEVLDPGSAPVGQSKPRGDYCYGLVYPQMQNPHVWSPVTIDGSGSTWFCSRCRRIERRTVVEGA